MALRLRERREMPKMERTAEILDTASGLLQKTGQGAIFVGKAECEERLRHIQELQARPDARFILDWHDANGDILDTFHLDEDGFRALTGEEPKTPDEYSEIDAKFWDEIERAGVRK
jgi:hypothetical protein